MPGMKGKVPDDVIDGLAKAIRAYKTPPGPFPEEKDSK